MDNLYTPSVLLSRDKFDRICVAFELAWCEETSYPDDPVYVWDPDNKALGHCSITSSVVCDLLGTCIGFEPAYQVKLKFLKLTFRSSSSSVAGTSSIVTLAPPTRRVLLFSLWLARGRS